MVAIGEQPLVSIITPVYNGAMYLEDLIQSVLQQDYPSIEHIIIDDGSTDDGATVAILKRYPHLRWWSRQNKGQYATLNEGVAAARGSILGIISADDMYVVPSTISTVIRYWQSHPEYAFVYGQTLRIDENGDPLPVQADINCPLPAWFLRYYLFIQHCSLFVTREIIVGDRIWFDPDFRCAGDWDWIIRLSKTGRRFGYLSQPLSLFRQHSSRVTQTTSREAMFFEYRKVCERHGANYQVFLLVRRMLGYRSKTLKVFGAMRVGGISGLQVVMRDWLLARKLSNQSKQRL
jgi:glycosyltransferase involved in cell wall biosynthesis